VVGKPRGRQIGDIAVPEIVYEGRSWMIQMTQYFGLSGVKHSAHITRQLTSLLVGYLVL
jgi:hypothetical protein